MASSVLVMMRTLRPTNPSASIWGDQIGVLRGCHGTLPSGRVDQRNPFGRLAAPVKHSVSSDDRITREVFEHLQRLHFIGDLRGQIQGHKFLDRPVDRPKAKGLFW